MTLQLTSLRMKTSYDGQLRFTTAVVFITILYVAIMVANIFKKNVPIHDNIYVAKRIENYSRIIG